MIGIKREMIDRRGNMRKTSLVSNENKEKNLGKTPRYIAHVKIYTFHPI
jgi:hypothetical protein